MHASHTTPITRILIATAALVTLSACTTVYEDGYGYRPATYGARTYDNYDYGYGSTTYGSTAYNNYDSYYDYGPTTYGSVNFTYYNYRYYPDIDCYYDPRASQYLYHDHDRWVRASSLPAHLRYRLGTYIDIRSRDERPYKDRDRHRQQYADRHRHNSSPRHRDNDRDHQHEDRYDRQQDRHNDRARDERHDRDRRDTASREQARSKAPVEKPGRADRDFPHNRQTESTRDNSRRPANTFTRTPGTPRDAQHSQSEPAKRETRISKAYANPGNDRREPGIRSTGAQKPDRADKRQRDKAARDDGNSQRRHAQQSANNHDSSNRRQLRQDANDRGNSRQRRAQQAATGDADANLHENRSLKGNN